MKEKASAVIGVVGGAIATAMGGWSAGLQALVICMAIDYVTGLMVAGIFHASPKTTGGGLESQAGWKGLCRKFATLLVVVLANQIDILLGTTYFRDAVIIGFCANETISITENAGLMGLPLPKIIKNGIEILIDKSENEMEEEVHNG